MENLFFHLESKKLCLKRSKYVVDSLRNLQWAHILICGWLIYRAHKRIFTRSFYLGRISNPSAVSLFSFSRQSYCPKWSSLVANALLSDYWNWGSFALMCCLKHTKFKSKKIYVNDGIVVGETKNKSEAEGLLVKGFF